MVFFALFGLSALLSLYFGSQSLRLYQSGTVNTHKRISWKILNDAIKKESNIIVLKKLTFLKYLYVVYLLMFYFSIFWAILKIYVAATSGM